MDRFVNKKIEKQTIYEIYRACRLCGAGGGYKMPIIQNVVDLESCDVELKQKIRECVQIEVHQDDKMPPLICELCVDKVNDFYEFLEMCRQTNKRTRLKLGLPPQMLPRGAPDAGDCILGVTEPVYVVDEDSNEPLSDKKNKSRGSKPNKELEKKLKEVKIKLEDNILVRESRSGRQRPRSSPSPPRLRRDRRPDSDNVALSRMQSKMKKSQSPPPKSILKKGIHNKTEVSPPSPVTRLKRSREVEVKHETATKKVKISLKPVPPQTPKVSPRTMSSRQKKEEAERKKIKLIQMKQREMEAERLARENQTLCTVCENAFKTPQAMFSHRRTHVVTYTNPKLACNPCGLWFPTVEEVEAHHRRHRRQAMRYRCWRCHHAATTLQGYNQHLENGNCLPWEEVPDVKCPNCWKLFPTQNLLDGHRCPGTNARPVTCTKCGKTYSSKKSFANHTRSCKKGGVNINPELRARLKPVLVRVAKCDPLLVNRGQEHYDVSGVPFNYGLDKNSVYPYISSRLRIKSEPSDCMVKINDLDFGSYVHWDSDDDSSGSDADNLDGCNLGIFRKKRKVESLAACSLRIIFSEKFLGKVPRKFKRVKIETIIDSTLNNSLSDLNLNDNDPVYTDKYVPVSTDKINDSEKLDDNDDFDLFPKVNSDAKVTNEDFDTIFNDKTGSGNNSNKSALVFDDNLVLANKNHIKGESLKDFDDLVCDAKDNIDSDNNVAVNVISSNNININVTESTNENKEKSIVKKISLTLLDIDSHEIQPHVKINYSGQEKPIIDKYDKLNVLETEVNHVTSDANYKSKVTESEGSLGNRDWESDDSTEIKNKSERKEISHTKIDKEDSNNKEKLQNCINKVEIEIIESSNMVSEAVTGNQNTVLKDSSRLNAENNSESITTISNVEKDLDADVNVNGSDKEDKNSREIQVNGDVDVDDVNFNMNDLEDLSDTELDDCKLMAEIDAQIGEKGRETTEKVLKIDGKDPKNNKTAEIEQAIENHAVQMDEKRIETRQAVVKSTDTILQLVKEKEEIHTVTDIKDNKITLEDLLPKEGAKSDLDSISDEEFNFDD